MSGHYDEADAGAPLPPPRCPHCFGDVHHHCDAQGCERHAQDLGERIQIGPTDV